MAKKPKQKRISKKDAMKRFESLPEKRKIADRRKTSKNTTKRATDKWMKDPKYGDVLGIDTKMKEKKKKKEKIKKEKTPKRKISDLEKKILKEEKKVVKLHKKDKKEDVVIPKQVYTEFTRSTHPLSPFLDYYNNYVEFGITDLLRSDYYIITRLLADSEFKVKISQELFVSSAQNQGRHGIGIYKKAHPSLGINAKELIFAMVDDFGYAERLNKRYSFSDGYKGIIEVIVQQTTDDVMSRIKAKELFQKQYLGFKIDDFYGNTFWMVTINTPDSHSISFIFCDFVWIKPNWNKFNPSSDTSFFVIVKRNR